MEIKTTSRSRLTPVRMATIKKTNASEDIGIEEPTNTLLTGNLVQLSWRPAWKFLKKPKIDILYHPAIPLLGMYPKAFIVYRNACAMLTTTPFILAEQWNGTYTQGTFFEAGSLITQVGLKLTVSICS